MKLAVLCPSEIALRRFMPALMKIEEIEYVGIGINSVEERYETDQVSSDILDEIIRHEGQKALIFKEQYGGIVFESYMDLILNPNVDAVYIPLPPALHYKWAKLALEHGKHVLVEKPSTTSLNDTKDLIQIADNKGLALHENYMFIFHQQLEAIDQLIQSGEIGDVRLYRILFGFPMRTANDFRYNKKLGGGAVIDAGGYTFKYATKLLGKDVHIKSAQMNYIDGYEVDMYGSATLVNDNGITAQVSFGMDNNYKCELEVWGSKGTITTGRVLTAPVGFIPQITIRKGNEDEVRNLPPDDAFYKSINRFLQCIKDNNIRRVNYDEIKKQAELVDEFLMKSIQ